MAKRTRRLGAWVGAATIAAAVVSAGIIGGTAGRTGDISRAEPEQRSSTPDNDTAGATGSDPVAGGPAANNAATVDEDQWCIDDFCLDGLDERVEQNLSDAVSDLAAAVARDPARASLCHELGHELGRIAVEHHSVRDALLHDDGACLFGFQHGVLEGWAKQVDVATLAAGLADACDVYPIDTYAYGSCSHGLGHAISVQRPGSVLEAVARCDVLAEHARAGCAGGVFMAYSTDSASHGGVAPSDPLPLTVDDVDTVCGDVGDVYAAECWSKLWLLNQRIGRDAAATLDRCTAAGTWVQSCAHGAGVALLYETHLDVEAALERCIRHDDPTIGSGCQRGVAWSNANLWVGANEPAATYRSICDGTVAGVVDVDDCADAEREALAGGR